MSKEINYGPDCIGNIIRIIDDRTVIVNVGKKILKVGDKIVVYEVGEPLFDITGEILANFEHQKEILQVIQTESQYSVCQKEENVTNKLVFAISPLLETKKTESVPMKVEASDIQELKPHDRYVRVGDPIKLA